MLGRQPVEVAVQHGQAFVDALGSVVGTVVDLGSGGGLPGLVIAWRRPDLRVVLVDRRITRADHLNRLVRGLGLDSQVVVLAVDIAELAASPLAAPVEAVVARSFASPAATARAAAQLLAEDGRLVVSEPPHTDPGRWPTTLLEPLGLQRVEHPDRRVMVAVRRPVRPTMFHVEQPRSRREGFT